MIAAGMLLASAIYAQENKTQKQEVATQEQTQEQEQKTTELEELVVKGENAWIENGKAVFIPQKSAKNLARDMASLIGRMNTGQNRARAARYCGFPLLRRWHRRAFGFRPRCRLPPCCRSIRRIYVPSA